MNVFPWARRAQPKRTVHLPADRPVFVVSDIHLGDGSRSDSFVSKDRLLMDFLAHVREHRAHLVINGDIIDFPQALTFTRVLRAHGPLLRAFSELAEDFGVTYVWGNHDSDIALYRDLLRWKVCSSVRIGEHVLLEHGHQYDPYVGKHLRESTFATLIHHQLERITGSWVRVPLQDFYTVTNRLTWWMWARMVGLHRRARRALARLGIEPGTTGLELQANYWIRSQVGDSMSILPAIRDRIRRDPDLRYLVCGHSHQPGRVEIAPGRFYVNDGSWTFRSTQYAHWDGETFHVRDWTTGREFGSERYDHLLSGDMDAIDIHRWWQVEYLGWLRFLSGELKRRGEEVPDFFTLERHRDRLVSPPRLEDHGT